MSGTLTPIEMFRDVLGIENVVEKSYPSSFPVENRLALVVPETSTKFTLRNDAMFEKIAKICVDVVNMVPGNSALFFPSYGLRDRVVRFFDGCEKKVLLERAEMVKKEKAELLDEFRRSKDKGAALLGVSAASFAEGIDLPGDELRAVVVVGLPLARPDIKTRALIAYYDQKFGRGWDYGSTFPAINKCLQAAGRCIRSETDKGMVLFLDQRFIWPNYFKCLPEDWGIDVVKSYREKVSGFFGAKA